MRRMKRNTISRNKDNICENEKEDYFDEDIKTNKEDFEKLFHTWEIPRSGSKSEDGERKKEREKERKLVIVTWSSSCTQIQKHI